MVWVGIWKISPKNVKFFNFFPLGQKKSLWAGSKSTWVKGGSASYLLRVKSKLRSGWVRAHLQYKSSATSQQFFNPADCKKNQQGILMLGKSNLQ